MKLVVAHMILPKQYSLLCVNIVEPWPGVRLVGTQLQLF